MQKVVVIIGPTSSGKSDLGVELAKKFDGEVISADSRQVYKGLDLGSGKITRKEMRGIPHHLLDVASPRQKFTVSQYQRLSIEAIASISRRSKLPIIVGGSPFYIYSVVDGLVIPEVKPNPKLRKELEKLTAEELFSRLKKLDPERAKTIEAKNPRRLVRALEIIETTGGLVPKLRKNPLPYSFLLLGIKRPIEELKDRIAKRLEKRLRQGMVEEVKNLNEQGLSWKRLEEFGLEYRYVAQFLRGKITKQEMINCIQKESEAFIRRQMVWFKRDKRIQWIESFSTVEKLVSSFLCDKI